MIFAKYLTISAQRTCESIRNEFQACSKNPFGALFCFVQALGNGGSSILSPKMESSLSKNREILTSGMLATGQKTLFDMLAQLLNTFANDLS